MIKFFRKIRQKLLSENKLSKYLLYAIGEIILVVIGILIAVSINDANNAAQNDRKIKAILAQIQEDILVDIKDSKRIFKSYISRNVAAHKIYEDKISVNSSIRELQPYVGWVNFSVNRSGYERLMANLESMPEKYNELLPALNSIYVVAQDDINNANANLLAEARSNSRFNRAYTDPEYAEHKLKNYSTEEAKQYLIDDPFLKNRTLEYMYDFQDVAGNSNQFRVEATALYKQIDSILGNQKAETPEILNLLPNKESIEPYLGTYTHYKGFDGADSLTIRYENNQLFCLLDKDRKWHLSWEEDNYFSSGPLIFEFIKNEEGKQFLDISGSERIEVYKKE